MSHRLESPTRRELLIGGAALAGAAWLGGCGGDGSSDGDGATRTVRHSSGTTEVPARPERVATVSEVVVAHLASVGLLVVASNDDGRNWVDPYESLLPERFDPSSIRSLGATDDVSFETLAAIGPEMILSESFSEDIYPQLSRIAPTVLIERGSNADWKPAFDGAVRAVGREREGRPCASATPA